MRIVYNSTWPGFSIIALTDGVASEILGKKLPFWISVKAVSKRAPASQAPPICEIIRRFCRRMERTNH